MKHQIVHAVQKYVLNPPIKLLFAMGVAPPGYALLETTGRKVEQYAAGLVNPRCIRTAPDGDIFVAESSAGRLRVFRGVTTDGKAEEMQIFAEGLNQPYGIAFYPPGPEPQWVYVANTDAVVRFPYRDGDMKASGPSQHIADLPHGGGYHWTRDLQFSRDGKKMFVPVGSLSNDDDPDTSPAEKNRADILEFDPDGPAMRTYAYGIRNGLGSRAPALQRFRG